MLHVLYLLGRIFCMNLINLFLLLYDFILKFSIWMIYLKVCISKWSHPPLCKIVFKTFYSHYYLFYEIGSLNTWCTYIYSYYIDELFPLLQPRGLLSDLLCLVWSLLSQVSDNYAIKVSASILQIGWLSFFHCSGVFVNDMCFWRQQIHNKMLLFNPLK